MPEDKENKPYFITELKYCGDHWLVTFGPQKEHDPLADGNIVKIPGSLDDHAVIHLLEKAFEEAGQEPVCPEDKTLRDVLVHACREAKRAWHAKQATEIADAIVHPQTAQIS